MTCCLMHSYRNAKVFSLVDHCGSVFHAKSEAKMLEIQAVIAKKAPQAEMMEASQWQTTKRRKGDRHGGPCLNELPASLEAEAPLIRGEVPPPLCQARGEPALAAPSIPVPLPHSNGQPGKRHVLLV